MPNSYTVKSLRVTFTLAGNNAVFPGTSANSLTVTGLRMSTVVKLAGIQSFPEASIRIWGMRQQDMNSLAVVPILVGKPQYTRNTVQIEADSGQGFVAIFTGQIMQAGPDYSSLPDVCLYVQASSLGLDQLTPVAPTSYPGSTQIAAVVQNIATGMGLAFENDGVTGTLPKPYYSGTLADQLRRVVEDAGIYYAIEPGTPNVLIISPAGVPRSNLASFTLSPQSGLVGYPEVLGNGYLNVRAIFNSAFRMNGPLIITGSDVVIDNSAPNTLNTLADGSWCIGPLTHILESQKPGGAWFTDMKLYPNGAPPPPAS